MLRSVAVRLIYRTRLRNGKNFQSRGYNQETKRSNRLERKFPEDNEPQGSRHLGIYIIPAAMLVVAGAAAFIKYNDEKRATLNGSNMSTNSGRSSINRPAIGGPFELFDTQNNLVTDSDLRGNWVLIYFGYTSSPDVGPEEVQKMAKTIEILESKHNLKIKPVFVTIDPQRDTPDQLREYLKEFDEKIVGLTGPINAVRQIAQEYRVYFRKVDEEGQDYLIESSNNIAPRLGPAVYEDGFPSLALRYLLDPNMEIAKCFGIEYCSSQLSDAIMKEVTKASK